jgi:MFS family permease
MRARWIHPLGLAVAGAVLAGCGTPAGTKNKSAPQDTASSWDQFYADWVKPVTHFGTPVLVVFAVLLVLARSAARVFVTKNSPGPRALHLRERVRIGAMYWVGVLALLWSAVEVTVAFPISRAVPSERHVPWLVDASIALIGLAAAVVPLPYLVVGRALQGRGRVPGEGVQRRSRGGFAGYARTGLTAVTAFIAIVGAALLIANRHTDWGWRLDWLGNSLAPLIYAPLLALLGVVIAGRIRGIGIGLLIQGHDKTGGEDAGLGAFIRARLYALGSNGPSGIQITQQTDVSSLPSEALSLIPEGTLAKLARLFVALFSPATPWRVDVTEQSDSSIVVSIMRNGWVADATVIRSGPLGLPHSRTTDVSTPAGVVAPSATDAATSGSAATSADAKGAESSTSDWSVELRTSAAAFVLLTMAGRYDHLRAGLSGASQWRSVALQVIASDAASRLSHRDTTELLSRAVAEDDGNVAAELALLNRSYRSSTTQADACAYCEKLTTLIDRMPNDDGLWPLRLRARFNLLVASFNVAAMTPPPEPNERPDLTTPPTIGSGAGGAALTGAEMAARKALLCAAEQALHLIVFWRDPRNQRAYSTLWREMNDAVIFAAETISAEWDRRSSVKHDFGWDAVDPGYRGRQMTLLARYERACALVARAAVDPIQGSAHYEAALGELILATAINSNRVWARTDPSMRPMHDIGQVQITAPVTAAALVERFKALIGDPVPQRFVELAALANQRDALEARGIRGAESLLRAEPHALAAQLKQDAAIVGRWRELAHLHSWLQNNVIAAEDYSGETAEATATRLLFLLGQAREDSVEAVTALTESSATRNAARNRLIASAEPWAAVAPSPAQMSAWLGTAPPPVPSPPAAATPPPQPPTQSTDGLTPVPMADPTATRWLRFLNWLTAMSQPGPE